MPNGENVLFLSTRCLLLIFPNKLQFEYAENINVSCVSLLKDLRSSGCIKGFYLNVLSFTSMLSQKMTILVIYIYIKNLQSTEMSLDFLFFSESN